MMVSAPLLPCAVTNCIGLSVSWLAWSSLTISVDAAQGQSKS